MKRRPRQTCRGVARAESSWRCSSAQAVTGRACTRVVVERPCTLAFALWMVEMVGLSLVNVAIGLGICWEQNGIFSKGNLAKALQNRTGEEVHNGYRVGR
jgi:hypothetical protein